MNHDPMLRQERNPEPSESGSFQPEFLEPAKPLIPATQSTEHQGSSNTFESFLTDVEQWVLDAGQLWLFTGDQLRLQVMVLRHEKNPHLIWGLKRHEDWAFKATLLRFARGSEPVHLILSTEHNHTYQIRGWVIRRTIDTFWASPLPTDQARRFWERCLAPFAFEKKGSA
jgi:hypothetical protein